MKKLVVAGLVMALLVGALGQTPATADEIVEPNPVDPA